MRTRATLVSFLAALAQPAMGQPATPSQPAAEPAKPAVTLKPGSTAPEFKVEKFLKGDPFTAFEKGKVYVVEFWATWCGPCIMSMPHLSELQHEYKDKGVTICGVNIWEDEQYSETTLTKASTFVEGKGDVMAYTVAYDGAARHMDTAWMKAAGRTGIPSAFVVDHKGEVAWIGHPMQLDMVLDEVVAGSWDIESGPAKVAAATKAFRDAAARYKEGLDAGDAAWADAMKNYPAMGRTQSDEKFAALLSAKHFTQAYALGNELVEKGRAGKDLSLIMGVFGPLTNPQQAPEQLDKELLLKAANAYYGLSNPKEYGAHVTMARAYFTIGDVEKGRASATTATELAPAEIRERVQAWLKQIEEEAARKKAPGPG